MTTPAIGPTYNAALRNAATKKSSQELAIAQARYDDYLRDDAYLVAADVVRRFARDEHPEHAKMLEKLARQIESSMSRPEAFGVAPQSDEED